MASSFSIGLWTESRVRLVHNVAVALVVLVASAFVAPRVSLTYILLTIGAACGIVGILAVLRWPSLGPLALIVSSLTVPFGIGTGTDSEINVAIIGVVALFGLWVLDVLLRQDARPAPSRLYLPLFALPAVATLAFAFGYKPEIPFADVAPLRAQIGGLAIFWISPVALVIVGHQVRGSRWLQALTWVYVGLGGVYIGARLAHIGIVTATLFQPGVTNGSLFYVWLVALSFSQAAFNETLRIPFRLGCAAITASALYLGFFQVRDWNSGWVPPLVAVGIAILIARPRIGVPLGILSAAGLALNFETVRGLLLNNYKEYDILTRQAAWTTLIPLIKINPILGLGPANYYWYTPLFTILGWNVHFNSHEQYMDLVLQTGILGLLCFVWLVSEVWQLGFSLRNRVRPGFPRAYVYGALGGLAATVVAGFLGDWFLPFVYNIGFVGFRASVLGWLFLGGLVVLHRELYTPSARTLGGH